MPNIKKRKLARQLFDALHCYVVMVKYTPLEHSSLSSLNCQPVVFFRLLIIKVHMAMGCGNIT